MDPVEPFMLRELKDHVLDRQGYGPIQVYHMKKPETSVYSVTLIFAENRIVIFGDIMLGERGDGIVSQPGYGLAWFSGELTWYYLASKFLCNDHWSAERAEQWCRDLAAEYYDAGNRTADEIANKIASYKELADDLKNGSVANVYEFDVRLRKLNAEWADVPPGYGYDEAEAGWLSAIQQKFAQLYNFKLDAEVKP
jgi:hypothetical protein